MTKTLVSALLLATALPASGADPAPISFDGDGYRFVAREAVPARVAEHYLREGETLERYSRRLTIADQPQAASAKAVALGVINIAKMRTPGIAPETFSAEGSQERDVAVAWYDLTDDGGAVEQHIARFVDLAQGGVREYHFTVRRYTNGQASDPAFAALRNAVEKATLQRVEELSALDRAPARADETPAKK